MQGARDEGEGGGGGVLLPHPHSNHYLHSPLFLSSPSPCNAFRFGVDYHVSITTNPIVYKNKRATHNK